MCDFVCTIQDITSSLYDLRRPCLCHHTHYIWHRVHCICVITSTVLMISYQLYFWDHFRYNSRHHIHCIRHYSHWICDITLTRLMISQPFYVWHHITPAICTSYTLYKRSRPYFMRSHHIIYDITCTVFMTSFPRYLTLHPQYLCPHNPSTYDLWTTVCMTSHPLYIWHLTHNT